MRFLFLLFIGFSVFIAPAQAAVNITQPLTFGSFALRNNSAVRQMRITAQDVFTSDAALRLADVSFARVNIAFSSLAPSKTASLRFASISMAPVRLAATKLA